MRHFRFRKAFLFAGILFLYFVNLIHARAQESESIPKDFSKSISLSELPKITREVLAAQNNILCINDPIPYDQSKGLGNFEIQILSEKNFKDRSIFSFAGDADSLRLFVAEIAYVNGGVAYAQQVYDPVKDALKSLIQEILGASVPFDVNIYPSGSVNANIYHFVSLSLSKEANEKRSQPVRETIDGIKKLGRYLRDSQTDDFVKDLEAIIDLVIIDTASKIAEKKGLNYFELKTSEAALFIEKEVKTFLATAVIVQLSKSLIERSITKRLPVPNIPAGKISAFIRQRKNLPNPSSIEKLAKAEVLFPETAKKLRQSIDKSVLNGPVSRKSLPSGSPRHFPVTLGKTTGGSSVVLGKNIGMPETGGWAAHHIIPSELKDHRVLKKVGMNMDQATNGIALPTRPGVADNLPLHAGSHPSYTKAVKKKLDEIPDNLSVTETQDRIREIQNTFKTLLNSGEPLHTKYGAKEPWIP